MQDAGIREVRLSTTPTPEAIADLQLGDIVYLDGLLYTAREGVYARALEQHANIPIDPVSYTHLTLPTILLV